MHVSINPFLFPIYLFYFRFFENIAKQKKTSKSKGDVSNTTKKKTSEPKGDSSSKKSKTSWKIPPCMWSPECSKRLLSLCVEDKGLDVKDEFAQYVMNAVYLHFKSMLADKELTTS